MKINRYIPILRMKRGEFRAIKRLHSDTRKLLTPLFEYRGMPAQTTSKPVTLEQYLKRTIENCAKCWPDEAPMIIDTPGLSETQSFENDGPVVEFFYQELRNWGVNVIPTITTDRSKEFCAKIEPFSDSFCFRILPDDLETPSSTVATIRDQKKYLNLNSAQCHLLIDMKCVDTSNHSDIIDSISQITSELEVDEWSSLIIGGCSFPEAMTGIEKHKKTVIRRREVACWRAVNEAKGLIGREAYFADYTIINPLKPELDGRMIKNIATKIRYATPEEWIIYRGESPESTEEKYDEYQELAHKLVNDSSFMGADFSWGDGIVFDCSTGEERCCGLEKWITVDINHHIKIAAEQVSDFFEDS